MAELNRQQFNYPKTPDDPGFESFRRVHELHGAGDVDAAFGEHGRVVAPWPRASRRKDRAPYDQEVVRQGLSQPAQVEDIDPRFLHATQPHVTRQGVSYYMDDPRYEEQGRTFADPGNVGNAFPVVYDREDGYRLLLSGHHRATAALLKGRGLKARRFEGPWGPER